MKTFLRLGLVASISILPAAATAFTPIFDESIGNPTTPAGLAGRLQSGNLVLCDAFDLGTSVCTGSNISDVVQWSGGSISFYASDLEPGQVAVPGTAETGIPVFDPNFGAGTVYMLEPAPATIPEVITYNPTQGASAQPGGILAPVGGDTVTYTITSDATNDAPVPEPATFVLLGGALLALGLVKNRFGKNRF